jgi:hypothetical protein
MWLSGLELRRDGDDMVAFLGQESEKMCIFGGGEGTIYRRGETNKIGWMWCSGVAKIS